MPLNDKKVVDLLKKGNSKAYDYLFETYYVELCNYATNLCRDRIKSEDIVQNVLIKLWRKQKNLKSDISIKNYLYRSVYNEFVDQYRKDSAITVLEKKYIEGVEKFYESKDEPEVEGLYQILKKEIEKLPPRCKETFILNKIEGLTYTEISEFQNVSINTVEKQMVKALKILRSNLKQKIEMFFLLVTKKFDAILHE
ncbi:RNA polymerase sigma-70 factor [Arenibacter sp. F20364]|jgi:RNA polymerase sigma-70 factor (ECF subfamily)|uniref:RNA polymerase sigma factor n=1 Tax=Arenibacter sp. F20364 TaxID=2926415 RepID=UPI001FF247C3|nr:RNA polymerase sigma-70 factor [Arenibacter sp. F20364]MCK0190694.1 RNA polymerase sigma-70 factor [Arenibacter sp. F20364]